MNSDNILAFIKRRMLELGYCDTDFTIHPQEYVIVTASTQKITDVSDFHFLSNIYSASARVLAGSIVSDDNADTINPLLLNKNYAQIQLYRGSIIITNSMSVDNMYVEFFKVTPLK